MNHIQSQNAIEVRDISKKFVIPHERIDTLKGAFVNIFKHKTFESFYALNRISFEIRRGEFFGILGRNGSGKSTLLKILAKVYEPDQGQVTVSGPVSPFLELGIGFNPELSGRDNVYLNATILGLSQKDISQKFDSIVSFAEMERFIDQKVKNYSSGMQVRLAFSVAVHAKREILLMDEVLAVGDAGFQKKCINEFEKFKQQGKTIILVTHDTEIVKKYCDRAMLLQNGKVEAIGKVNDVALAYERSNSLP
jgi:ABC-type polysaccharide/polyol phosphate transport system ATPase subunit